MAAKADELTQRYMIQELYKGVIESNLLTRFATLESEHAKRGQNCPLLLSIQNGKEARVEADELDHRLSSFKKDIYDKFDTLKDELGNVKVSVGKIVAVGMFLETIVLGIVMWLIQRGG